MRFFLFLFLSTLFSFPCISVSAQGLDGPIFHIVGNDDVYSSYTFNINGIDYPDPELKLIQGQTYQFSIDYINDGATGVRGHHPFGFTSTSTGGVQALGAIGTTGCTTLNSGNSFITLDTSNPCIVNYTANNDAYYRCALHGNMKGKLTVITPTTTPPTPTPTPESTPTPTPEPTPTPTPEPTPTPTTTTTPPPPTSDPSSSSSSTGSTIDNSSSSSSTTTTSTNSTSTNTTQPPIFHIIGSNGTRSYIFNINGIAIENPSLDLVLGETYQFSIDYLNVPTNGGAPHPFGFSRDGGETASVEALGAIGNVNCQTSPPNAFVTTDVSKPCIITYVANVNSFYRCAYHDPMKGALTVIPTNTTNNNPPSSSPTTSTPTNGTPSTFNGTIFHIIGSRASASYIFNISGIAVENPSLDLILGKTYQFSIDYNNDPATGVPHPFGFSTNGGTAASIENVGAIGNVDCKIMDNAFITTNIFKPCIITYTPKVNTFYRCSFHGPMKGALNVIGTAPSSTAGPAPTENPNCVAGVCVNAASSISTSAYLTIIASLIALAATAF